MTDARYDEVADWYDAWVGDTPSEGSVARVTAEAVGEVSGRRVLDVACGNGAVARYLAARGATVEGVDLAAKLIDKARAAESRSSKGIRYHVGSATDTAWWDGVPFDAVICNMAASDIDDFDAAIRTMHDVLVPGGPVAFSLLHPCFPGHGDGLSSWPPYAGYFAEGWWTTGGEGCRGRVGAHHRTLATYINTVIERGLRLERVLEPPFPGDDSPGLPSYLVVAARRGT